MRDLTVITLLLRAGLIGFARLCPGDQYEVRCSIPRETRWSCD